MVVHSESKMTAGPRPLRSGTGITVGAWVYARISTCFAVEVKPGYGMFHPVQAAGCVNGILKDNSRNTGSQSSNGSTVPRTLERFTRHQRSKPKRLVDCELERCKPCIQGRMLVILHDPERLNRCLHRLKTERSEDIDLGDSNPVFSEGSW
jgi:hypothetical protein